MQAKEENVSFLSDLSSVISDNKHLYTVNFCLEISALSSSDTTLVRDKGSILAFLVFTDRFFKPKSVSHSKRFRLLHDQKQI
jgi:hypothetical protein